MSEPVHLVPCPDRHWYWLMYGEEFRTDDGRYFMRAEHVPEKPATPAPIPRGDQGGGASGAS